MKRSKFGNRITVVNGIKFHSKAEALRYVALSLAQRAGDISGLVLQPPFTIFVEGRKIGKFVADFQYCENGKLIVEDVKGIQTDLSKWQHKLFRATYPQLELRLIPAHSVR
jgi:hypothetical protein